MAQKVKRGAKIEIFLHSGEADGIWEVTKGNWTGKALVLPRSRYKDLDSSIGTTGVYVLVGPSDSEVYETKIYIGVTDDQRGIMFRIGFHNRNKEFWTKAIVFTETHNDLLNSSGAMYIESKLIELAKAADKVEVENKTSGNSPSLSKADTDELDRFLDEMLLIYPLLDLKAFQKLREESKAEDILKLSEKLTEATGVLTTDGFTVFAGSLARAEETSSIGDNIKKLRSELLRKGIFTPEGSQLRLRRDYPFSSPSSAASIMLARQASGPLEWKTNDGKTLKELQESEASD